MRELSANEIEKVHGGLTPRQAEVLIGGAVLFAGIVGAPAAAAFGGGVMLGTELALCFD